VPEWHREPNAVIIMNERIGIPLRPDPRARDVETKRSYVRAVTSIALSKVGNIHSPERICKAAWPSDEHAGLLVRAAVSPTTTADYIKVDVIKLLGTLAPRSAAAKLFELSAPVDLSGINSILFPLPGALPTASFVGEGQAIPVLQGTISGAMRVGPVHKLALISPLTEELESASAGTASVVIGRLLEVGISRGLDKALFSTNAPTAISPAGLLYNTPALPASGGTTLSEDLGSVVESIANAGFDPEEVVFIASTRQALAMRLLAGPQFEYKIIGTPALPPKSIMGVDPSALAFAYAGQPETVMAREPTIHFADTPLPLVDNSGVVASPSKNLWQAGCLAIRTKAMVAWAAGAGSIAWVTGVAW
jgi:hypothetical protein